jgi:hypothetical protein
MDEGDPQGMFSDQQSRESKVEGKNQQSTISNLGRTRVERRTSKAHAEGAEVRSCGYATLQILI